MWRIIFWYNFFLYSPNEVGIVKVFKHVENSFFFFHWCVTSPPVEYTNQPILFTAIRNLHLQSHNKNRAATASSPNKLNNFVLLCFSAAWSRAGLNLPFTAERTHLQVIHPPFLWVKGVLVAREGQKTALSKSLLMKSFLWSLLKAFFSKENPRKERMRRKPTWSSIAFLYRYVTCYNNLEEQLPNTALGSFIQPYRRSCSSPCLWHVRSLKKK